MKAILHSEHGRDVDEARQMKKRRALLRNLMYPLADTVATVSEELGDWLAAHVRVRREKLVCVPNGVRLDLFENAPCREDALRAFNLPAHATVIGSVGRHDPAKDYGGLLRAFAQLCGDHSDAHLLLVGAGAEHESLLAQAAQLGVSDRTHFAGWSDDLPLAFAAIDVFVLPSVTEGMSNALLEAMAAGLPCIGTAVGGNGEVIEHGETGFLVEPRDPGALAESIAPLIADAGLRARLGAAGRRRVESHFTLPRMIARYEELYLSLIEHGRGRKHRADTDLLTTEPRHASHARAPRRAATPAPQDLAARAARSR